MGFSLRSHFLNLWPWDMLVRWLDRGGYFGRFTIQLNSLAFSFLYHFYLPKCMVFLRLSCSHYVQEELVSLGQVDSILATWNGNLQVLMEPLIWSYFLLSFISAFRGIWSSLVLSFLMFYGENLSFCWLYSSVAPSKFILHCHLLFFPFLF